MAQSPRILLHGIQGTYNFGCEAIVRGTAMILRHVWPDADICYASPRMEADQHRLRDINIRVCPRTRYPKWSAPNVMCKLAIMAGVRWRPLSEPCQWLHDRDIVLSIGGDRYTLTATGGYDDSLLRLDRHILKRGKALVIWGASIGPFESNPAALRAFKDVLQRADLITSREPACTEYLRQLGVVSNVVSCGDPAFMIPGRSTYHPGSGRSPRIAVNLSPLSVSYTDRSGNLDRALAAHSDLIARLVDRFDATILLVPHVLCPNNPLDNDLSYLQALQQALPPRLAERSTLIEEDLGFEGTKERLIACDLVLAARMHCAISALAAGVPTILLAYSRKALGMADYVFGHRRWVVTMEHATPDTICALVDEQLHDAAAIHNQLQERVSEIRRDALHAGEELAKRIQYH